MKKKPFKKREISDTVYVNDGTTAKYYAYTPVGAAMNGFRIVTEGQLEEGDYLFSGTTNYKGRTKDCWCRAMGAIGDNISQYYTKACRPLNN